MISPSAVVRGLAIGMALLCAAAIALGRMCSPSPAVRIVEPFRFVSLSGTERGADDRPMLLDLEEGRTSRVELPSGTRLDQPACSPWREEDGGRQVVGRWTSRPGLGSNGSASEIGLGRFRFPGGEVLDRVATEITPIGVPCWYPGPRARILFADVGGTLHTFAFEGSRNPGGRDFQPTPIVWAIHPPGEGERSVRILDPTWPREPGFAHTLIVSLSQQTRQLDRLRFTPPRLWWLRLDAEGTAIEAAGPLTLRDAETGQVSERCPRLVNTAEGRPAVAFLVRHANSLGWELAVAPLAADSLGRPVLEADHAAVLARSCALAAPAASPDGRSIYYLQDRDGDDMVRRVALRVESSGFEDDATP